MRLSKKIFIITGPSAAGKTTIARALVQTDLPLAKVITTTSRSRRRGEKEDRDYHFVSPTRFKQMIRTGKMFEWAKFTNHYYGSRKKDVEHVAKAGKYPIWVVDTQGADFLGQKYRRAVTIFIMPSSFSILRKRLEKRRLPEAEIRARLRIAQQEIKKAPKYDHRIINYDGRLEDVVREAKDLIKREIS